MTLDATLDIHGVRVFVYAAEGDRILGERDTNEIMSAAWSQKATMLAIPVARLGENFFPLSTRVAGEVLQKLVTYHFRVAIVGDISAPMAASEALRDFVRETNRGTSVWFVATIDELRERLAG